MVLELDIKTVGLDETRKELKRFAKEIPWAAKEALNDVAFEARRTQVANLSDHFTIRGSAKEKGGWLGKGTRIDKATKDNLVTTIGNIRDFARPHVFGGPRPRPSDGYAIPRVGSGLARPKHTSRIRQKSLPGGLLERTMKFERKRGRRAGQPALRFFAGVPRNHPDKPAGVWRRTGGRRGHKRLMLAYTFPNKVEIEKRWPWNEEIREVVDNNIEERMIGRLQQALEGKKRKKRKKKKKGGVARAVGRLRRVFTLRKR